MEPDEEMRSFDVTALFTSVPLDKALIVAQKLEEDRSLSERTPLSPANIVRLLEICLKCTYFVVNGQFYLQTHGAAMGSPVSPIICNLYMEDFKQKAIATAEHPPLWWFRYMDITHTKLKTEHAKSFIEHLNTIDDDIKWTTGEVDGELAFLDCCTIRTEDGSINTKVYHKATHTSQYLNWESNHPTDHKIGVVRSRKHCIRPN